MNRETITKEYVNKLIIKLKSKHGSSESNSTTLKEVARELQKITSILLNGDEGHKWDSIDNGITHTARHIEDLDSKIKKHRVDAYKYGYEQTLVDLEEIADLIGD